MSGKGNPLLSVRIPPDLEEQLQQYVASSGASRSEIAIAALTAYLMPAHDELLDLKRRLAAVERRVGL